MQKHVLVVTNMFPSAGDPTYGRFVHRCVESLRADGLLVDVASMPKHATILGKMGGYLRFSALANAKILFGKYDCVYLHHPLHSLLVCVPALALRRPHLVINFHGHDLVPVTQRGAWLKRLCRPFLRYASIALVPSIYFKSIFDREYGEKCEQKGVVFSSGGVSEDYFLNAPPPLYLRARTALFLSRFDAGKGWRTFIEFAYRLRSVSANFTFTIAGVGPDRSILAKEIDNAGLGASIKLVDATSSDANRELFRQHRYFIFPTMYEESLGLVNLEAMASGCVVLSSDFQAAREYLEHGVSGFRFPVAGFVDDCVTTVLDLENALGKAQKIATSAAALSLRYRERTVMASLPRLLGVSVS